MDNYYASTLSFLTALPLVLSNFKGFSPDDDEMKRNVMI